MTGPYKALCDMPKTFSRVWQECQTLTKLECRAFMLKFNRLPEPLAECDHGTALSLYLADILKFDKVGESNAILSILRHYADRLEWIANHLQLEWETQGKSSTTFRLGIFDGRFVTITGEPDALDLDSGETVPIPRNELKTVTYNLSTLMTARWFSGQHSTRLENSETRETQEKPTSITPES